MHGRSNSKWHWTRGAWWRVYLVPLEGRESQMVSSIFEQSGTLFPLGGLIMLLTRRPLNLLCPNHKRSVKSLQLKALPTKNQLLTTQNDGEHNCRRRKLHKICRVNRWPVCISNNPEHFSLHNSITKQFSDPNRSSQSDFYLSSNKTFVSMFGRHWSCRWPYYTTTVRDHSAIIPFSYVLIDVSVLVSILSPTAISVK